MCGGFIFYSNREHLADHVHELLLTNRGHDRACGKVVGFEVLSWRSVVVPTPDLMVAHKYCYYFNCWEATVTPTILPNDEVSAALLMVSR